MRRLLIQVDAGERECGDCSLLDVDDVGTSLCLPFSADPWSSNASTYVRLPECLAAEDPTPADDAIKKSRGQS